MARGPGEEERRQQRERRLHEAALTRALGRPPAEPDAEARAADADARFAHQGMWVDLQIRAAMARGEFDDLPGAGKPLRLPERHDPDWWVKGLIRREGLSGVLPPALALRKEDAALCGELDRLGSEAEVRRTVADFNRRVVEARRQLLGGPPVITPLRDVEAEVAGWRDRRRPNPDSSATRPRETPRKSQTNRGWRWWRR